MASTPDSARSTRWRGFLGAGVVAALLSSVVCALVYVVARAAGVSLLLEPVFPGAERQTLELPNVVIACVVPALLATVAFALLTRLTRRPLEVLLGVGFVLLLASIALLVPLDMDTWTKVVLGLMHVLAFVFILGPLVGMVEPPAPAPASA